MVKILIADDHTVLREGLKSLFSSIQEEWEVVAEANDGFQVLSLVETHFPDLLILDLSMPNLGGIATIGRLQKLKHKPQVLVLTAREDDISASDAMNAGANGFIPKSSDYDELIFAIKALLKGQTYISPSVAKSVLANKGKEGATALSPISGLSNREREVMKLLSEGNPNREVAKMLHVSPRTIDSHRANIMKKLGISSNAELVQIAIKSGLI